ncbi:hypothetical protein EU528_01450 [Candidatus Thorarchaeota archaeon]|nr:MAG: hypothetical protein EU528_01450 [Candidatus Thorarchaeota archaeon]
MRRPFPTTALLVIAALLVVSMSEVIVTSGFFESESLVTGPYIDEVIFKVLNQDQRALALQSGDIELDASFFDPVHLQTFEADPDISIFQAENNGYHQLVINCAKYPLNISGFRRAFAYAFNKTKGATEILYGFSVELDSVLPKCNPWCIEDQFTWNYYAAQPEVGNQILDDLNFTINTGTGFRETPDGTPFCVEIAYPACSCDGYSETSQLAVDALRSLGINAEKHAIDFNDYVTRLITHGDYDIAFSTRQFYNNDIDWLAYDFGSEYADFDGENPSSFANDTFDIWIDQLLYGTSYEDVYEASAEMQKILHYNVPVLIAFERTFMQAYRNDQFTGHVEDMGQYMAGPWTLRNMHLINGSFGGSARVAIQQDPCTFNIFSLYSAYCCNAVFENIWPSLYKYSPDITPIPDIATNLVIETHSDNPAVPDGHTRFTVDIVQNATWSDGIPLTADDIAFTYIYAKESAPFGYPAGKLASDMVAVYSPTLSKVVVEYTTESYWHFNNFAYRYIIPVHIFNDSGGIGYEGWNTWNPVFDPNDPHVTCGPFVFSDYVEHDYYRMVRNTQFQYAITPPTTTTNTTSTANNQTTTSDMFWPIMIGTTVITGTGMVVIVYVIARHQNRKV